MAITSQNWTISAISVELRRSKQTVAEIIDQAKILPVEVKGKSGLYKLADVVNAMVGSQELDLQQEKAKLAVEQSRRLRMQNDAEERRLAPVDEITDVLAEVCAIISSGLDALPLTLKKRSPSLTGKDIELIRKEIAKCRNVTGQAILDYVGKNGPKPSDS